MADIESNFIRRSGNLPIEEKESNIILSLWLGHDDVEESEIAEA
jgi:hypothetical protein